MSIVIIDDSKLFDIGDSIREQLQTANRYKPSEMPAAIRSISGYPEPTGSITITQNGSHNIKDKATAVVNVPNSYSAEDEGKVVDSGALVAQSSQTITENGTYDTTLKNEVTVDVEGGGGGSVDVDIPVNEYAFNYTPASNASQTVSGGFAFTTSKRIKVSKLRVWARETTASAYISQGNENIASVVDATVIANQWNDLTLNEPIILEADTTYVVWYSMPNYACRYKSGSIASDKSYITYIGGRYSASRKTIPTNSENNTYAVDFYIDAYIETRQAVLISKTITQNGTYDPTDDNADGYNEVTVNVSGSAKNILSGTDVPTSSVGSDGDIYLQYVDVPSAYTALEYIQGTGTQYINTGVNATSDIAVEIDFDDADLNGGDPVLFGTRLSWSQMLGINNGGYYTYTNIMYLYYGGDGNAVQVPEMEKAIIKLENGKRTIDGAETSFAQTTFSYAYPIFIFAANSSGSASNFSKYKLKRFKIWDSETLVRDFVPVKRNSDDVVGLYDVVNDTFYTNAGSGTFIAGKEFDGNGIVNTKLKVNGAWQELIGSDIDDVNTGE